MKAVKAWALKRDGKFTGVFPSYTKQCVAMTYKMEDETLVRVTITEIKRRKK